MKTIDQVIGMMESMMGCNTPVYTTDAQGNNASYNATSVDDMLEREFAPGNDWTLTGYRQADASEIDIEQWAQEMPQNAVDALAQTMADGDLYIASFHSDSLGYMEVMIWE